MDRHFLAASLHAALHHGLRGSAVERSRAKPDITAVIR